MKTLTESWISQPITLGIRPVIDGRRMGVRESLEAQTMAMAESAAELISSCIRHPDGSSLRCVIAETTIAGRAESARCDALFRRENVGLTLTVTPCWCYGDETIDNDPLRPKAIWGFNGTERPGVVYLAAALAAHNQQGLPAFGISGRDVQDADDTHIPADVEEKLLRFVRAGLVVASLRGKSYLSVGSISMGIAGSIVDHHFFAETLGMQVQSVDMTELRRRIDCGIYDEEELALAISWAEAGFVYGEEVNPPEFQRSDSEKRRILQESLTMALCLRDMMQGNPQLAVRGFNEEATGYNAIAGGFQGQRHWTDHYPNADIAEALLNSSFDWNGPRQPILMATENDSLNAVSMLFGHYLTGKAQIFADMRTCWSPQAVFRVTGHQLAGRAAQGIIHLINSGSAALDGSGAQRDEQGLPTIKPHWQVTPEDAQRCLAQTLWCPAVHEYFRGGGFSSNFLTPGDMPFTLSRINLIKGVGPVLQLAEGWSVELPEDVHQQLDQRTNSTWPTTWFTPRLTGQEPFNDASTMMNCWGANHGVLTPGHVGADLITLAAMLRIPVCLHNLPDVQLFRPSAWSAFGMDKAGQDYRACQHYGPLYK